MPVRNGEASLEQAARSVLDSTLRELELVIVDDFSTDGTATIISRLESTDPRVRASHPSEPGLVAAVNHGVSCCRGALIARMDSDDICMPDRFEIQIKHLHDRQLAGVGGYVRVVDRSGGRVCSWQRYASWINGLQDPDSIAAYRFVESPLVNPTMLVQREVFELGHRDGPWPEDYDLWLRAMAQGFRFGKVTNHVLDWIDHPARVTRTDPRYSTEAFDRCRRMHLLEGPLSGVNSVNVWGAGQTGKPWIRWLQAAGITVNLVIDVASSKIGQRIHSVPVMCPEDLGVADGTLLVIAVGAEGARELILDHIRPLGFVPGRDAWFVA
jgi:hypothetical protein